MSKDTRPDNPSWPDEATQGEEVTQRFTTGAARSKMKGRPDLIPKAAIDAMARRLELGTKYGENNWRLGGEDFRKATLGHLLAHLMDYSENGNKSDENTDAIICNAAFLCQYELEKPYPGVSTEVLEEKRRRDAKDKARVDEYCPACNRIHRVVNGVDVEDHAVLKDVKLPDEKELATLNARIRRVLGESDRRTHAQQADAIVKELFLS